MHDVFMCGDIMEDVRSPMAPDPLQLTITEEQRKIFDLGHVAYLMFVRKAPSVQVAEAYLADFACSLNAFGHLSKRVQLFSAMADLEDGAKCAWHDLTGIKMYM
jgi:hypothetical protein